MALVYAGHDLVLGRDVAIKTLRPQFAVDPAVRDRFARESRAVASLAHPNIVDIYDVGEADGSPYIVMELVSGQTLKQIIAEEAPFHPGDVAQLVNQVASALDLAHSRGYVHRDIKPGNIVIDDHNRVRVLDFGIAKGIADADLTDAGGGFGTAGYISPEQAEGLMATPASDIYSLGVVAYEMLTARPPFIADSPIALAMQHIRAAPPPPSTVIPSIPSRVEQAVLRALEKNPTMRWPSAGEFAAALAKEPTSYARAARRTSPAPSAVSRPGSGKLTLLVAIAIFGAIGALVWFGLRPDTTVPVSDPTIPAILPSAPEITGGVEANPEQPLPTISVSVPVSEPSVTAEIAPTIAPAGEAVVVPDLQGQSIAQATRELLSRNLRIALGQPEPSDTVPLNAIVRQNPPPGTAVQPGQIVTVNLSRGPNRGRGGLP